MSEEEKAIEFLEKFVGNFYEFPNPTAVSIRDYEVTNIEIVLNLIKSQQEEIEKKNKIINILFDERNYIINNLETDLNRRGIYSEAKGQISQILEYYKNNDKYFEKKVESKQ